MSKTVRGFTLVELLIAIAILAVLFSVAVVFYGGIQARARDTKRKEDIDAIAKALEVHVKDSSCLGGNNYSYCYLKNSFFASVVVPYDPTTTHPGPGPQNCSPNAPAGDTRKKECSYCVKYPSDADFSPSYCRTGNPYVQEDSPSPDNGWMICANLESGNPDYYCRRSQQ